MAFTPRPPALRTLPLAADARLSRTDYADDQAWDFAVGALDAPALALQTRYGGRVGLASLVPMWLLDGRVVYQAQAYARPPAITAFAPGYVRAEANLTPLLALTAEYWAMESHAVGARYTLTNTSASELSARLDLFGQVAAGGRPLKLAIVALGDGRAALALGELPGLRPVALLEAGGAAPAAGGKASPKIGQNFVVPPGRSVTARWVHAGLEDLRDSLALADAWLARDWSEYFRQIELASEAIPVVETGRAELDSLIALSYHHLVQSVLRPGPALPYASFVAARGPAHGYSPSGDGGDHDRAWSGQPVHLAYPTALALAGIDAPLARGILLNFLAAQTPDGPDAGSIDARPGMAGQRLGMAALPLLARLALRLHEIDGGDDWLREAAPKLRAFYAYWMKRGGTTGLPSWDDERQTGYLFFPTFGKGRAWAQNAEISAVVGPDMAAYLLGEARALRAIFAALGDGSGEAEMAAEVARLTELLGGLWDAGARRFVYRDRDTGLSGRPIALLNEARADEEHFIAHKLHAPARLVVRVTGGTNKTPRFSLTLNGLDAEGRPVTETAAPPEFGWYRGYGVYTTRQPFSQLDRAQTTGLSRVYRLDIDTLDTSRQDLNSLLPLALGTSELGGADLPALRRQAADPDSFARTNGLSMTPATDEAFDPSDQGGSGATWPFWTALIAEGLLDLGGDAAGEGAALIGRLLRAQAAALEADGGFHEFYHSAEPRGLGEAGHLGGIAPLYALSRALGVVITSSSRAWVGGPFLWDAPVTVRQHGVTVTRAAEGSTIAFPSGHVVELDADAAWALIADPEAVYAPEVVAAPPPPQSPAVTADVGKVLIPIQIDES